MTFCRCVVARTRDFAREANGFRNRELLHALEVCAQRLPTNNGHHVVQEPVHLTAVEEGKDVRMQKLRSRLDLAQESLATERRAEIGMQRLDGDVAIVLEIVREIDGGHAARAELTLDAVDGGKCRREARFDAVHRLAASTARFI